MSSRIGVAPRIEDRDVVRIVKFGPVRVSNDDEIRAFLSSKE
jgi:hypothetical protein